MESYAIPIGENREPISRSIWKRCLTELNGKLRRNHIHDDSPLLMQSYSEIGAFPHTYYIEGGAKCYTHFNQLSYSMLDMVYPGYTIRYHFKGVPCLEFDSKGIYLASGTRL